MTPAIPVLGDSLWLASPSLLLAAMAVVVMLAEAFLRPATKTGFWALSLLSLGAALVLSVVLFGQVQTPVDAFGGMLRVDRYGLFFQVVTLLAGLLSVVFADDYLERLQVRVGEYYALVLFGVSGMGLMGFAQDLMMVFISLEVMSIAMYVLCALKRADPRSVESGFKYFILGAFSSGLMLYGISLVYGAVGSTSLTALAAFLQADHGGTEGTLLAVGGVLLLVGFGFKVASVPFHLWAADVYQGAPISVTALMASGVKAASFAAFGRLVIGAMGEHAVGWAGGLWWMAALTMVVGNLAALVQNDLKRMLAYSSVAHAGYLLMGLSSATSAPGSDALASLLFYLVAYTFMNAGAFAVLSAFTRDGDDRTDIRSLAGLGRSNPWLAAALSLCLLSLAGIPPTIGFVGKFYLFLAAVQADQVGLAIIGALGAATGIYYYLRPMVVMYMEEGTPQVNLSRSAMVGLAVSVLAIVLVGLAPSGLLGWAEASLRSVVAGG